MGNHWLLINVTIVIAIITLRHFSRQRQLVQPGIILTTLGIEYILFTLQMLLDPGIRVGLPTKLKQGLNF
jgi:hypothetical protein